jgi:hypothetical protein
MHRVNIDTALPAVKEFVRALTENPDGVDIELGGRVVGRFIGPHQLTDAEREAILNDGWKQVQAAQARNAGVPARVIEQEVRHAVEEVRRRKPA